ncbi:MAG: hypothetical protein ACLQEQ_03670 [Nitrososphaerales archaeon]
MKEYSVAALVVGILMLIFGIVFALQGEGTIGGSTMSNNPFWIYAGSAIAIVGVVIAVVGCRTGSRSRNPKTITR